MNATELREKTVPELKASLEVALREQFKLRLVKAGGEMTDTHKIREVRRNIARIVTVLTQKEKLENQKGKQS
jgi:large subunit ribosomal protein L29